MGSHILTIIDYRYHPEQTVITYMMKSLLVIATIITSSLNDPEADADPQFPFGPLGTAFGLGLGPPGPFLPPRPAAPPTLQFQIPPGTCGLTCTVFDTLAVNPTFSTLVTAVRAAGLVERLSGPDPVTVFAPTNAAFALLPPAKLQVLLSQPDVLEATLFRHMTAGLILSSALNAGPNPVVTGAGEEISVVKQLGGPYISIQSRAAGGNIIEVDIGATNGVIHVIDVVL